MANPERGEVGITIGDQQYTLRLTINAICTLEEMTGRTITEIYAAGERGQMTAIRALVWAYLQECHSQEIRTLDDAGKWIHKAGGLPVLMAVLQQAAVLNVPPDGTTNGQGPAARERPRKAQGGGRSTSRAAGPA